MQHLSSSSISLSSVSSLFILHLLQSPDSSYSISRLAMADNQTQPTLLGIPPETRLLIYRHLFSDSRIDFCSWDFHDTKCVKGIVPNTGPKPVSVQRFPYQITAACRKLREEALHLLLQNIELVCCHLITRQTPDEVLCDRYLRNVRLLSIDIRDVSNWSKFTAYKLLRLPTFHTLEIRGVDIILAHFNDDRTRADTNLSPETDLGDGTAIELSKRRLETWERSPAYQMTTIWDALFGNLRTERSFRIVIKASAQVPRWVGETWREEIVSRAVSGYPSTRPSVAVS